MDSTQLRSMIRASIGRQVSEARRKFHSPPTDFDTFRRMVSSAVADVGGRRIAEAFESREPELFTPMWDIWTYVDEELRECNGREEAVQVWNEAVDFYTPGLMSAVVGDEMSESLTPPVSKILKERMY